MEIHRKLTTVYQNSVPQYQLLKSGQLNLNVVPRRSKMAHVGGRRWLIDNLEKGRTITGLHDQLNFKIREKARRGLARRKKIIIHKSVLTMEKLRDFR